MLHATLEHPLGSRWAEPGGPWDGPTLDGLLSTTPVEQGPAVVDGARRVHTAELGAMVAAVAGGLRAQGARRGDVVAWQLPNCLDAVVLCRACWRLGAVAAPLHHQAGAADVERMLGVIDPAVVVEPGALPTGDPVTEPAARPADLALVQFTSGSTGVPKAVLQTHRSLAYKARTMLQVHGLDSGDVTLMPSPIAHISGLLNGVLVPGAAGMPVVLMDKWDPSRGLDLIDHERVTFMVGPPTLFTGVMAEPGFTPERVASMRVISSGAMGVRPSFVAEAQQVFGAHVKRSYGSTEAPTVTTCAVGDPLERACDSDGRAVGAAEVVVVDPATGEPVPPGERGEVRVRGPELFAGYALAEQTREAMVDDWFRTGDLGTLDSGGWLRIVGRLKDVIIRGGENIAASEVEQVLEAHPVVREAVAVGYPDERLGERVAAFVVADGAAGTDSGAGLDVAWCRRWFTEQGIARFKTPERVFRVDAIPLLGSGKPDRTALRERAAVGDAPVGRSGD